MAWHITSRIRRRRCGLSGPLLKPGGVLARPLPQAARRLVHTHLRMQRDMLGDHIAADDRKALEVLLDEESADGVLHRGDVFLLSASTVHTGQR